MSAQSAEKPTQTANALSAPAVAAMAPMIDSMRTNAELMSQLGLIVSRANQTMAARQAAVIAEAVDDLTTLMQQAMPSTRDPSAITRAYTEYSQSVFRRGFAHLSFAVDSAAELSKAALELAQQRFLTEPDATSPKANGRFPPVKT